jgi:diguanylate cyclase
VPDRRHLTVVRDRRRDGGTVGGDGGGMTRTVTKTGVTRSAAPKRHTPLTQRRTDNLLPVPLSAYGPMHIFSQRVYHLNLKGLGAEALRAADAFECVARLAGDERTVRHITHARMYAFQTLGRWNDALQTGERLLAMDRESGDRVSEAKVLADLADTFVKLNRLEDGLHSLALAMVLLEDSDRRHGRYFSALSSVSEAARSLELYELADESGRTAIDIGKIRGLGLEATDLQNAENAIEWALRLDHIGRRDEALTRLKRAAAVARGWVERLEPLGPAHDSPWAKALLALALAKLGETAEALEVAAATVRWTRTEGLAYEARLAHLAYAIALHDSGDRAASRREFLAAIHLAVEGDEPVLKTILEFELAVLTARDGPEPAASDTVTALRGQAQLLWRVRLERIQMLRQARRRIELEEARARADDRAMRDPLTGLGNRRAFDQQIAAIPTETEPLVLLLIDLDHFKHINDTYSHSVGDRVLTEVAATLRAHCRQHDLAVRFGGDEFAVFLRVDLGMASRIGDRIRQALADRDWNVIADGLDVTTSIGAAALRIGMTGQQLFDAADKQLYDAKHAGRNQVAA